MALFTLFDSYIRDQLNGTIDLDTHSFKAVLTNTAPTAATDEILANITQIANGNGYTTGGVTLTSVTLTEPSPGVWQFTAADFSWTAAGGTFGPFRWVVIYDDTPTSPADPLVGLLDYGSSISITDGNSFSADIGVNGIIQFSEA